MFHPLIRLLSFLIFAAFVSTGDGASIILGFFLLLGVYFYTRQSPGRNAWQMIKRMRYFYISIGVMFLWFTPGELIFPFVADWSPTFEGLFIAAQRIIALAILVLGVECLLRLTSRSSLIVGLYYFSWPFTFLGVDRERFIIRVLLTMDYADSNNFNIDSEQKPTKKFTSYIDLMSSCLADKINHASHSSVAISKPITVNLQTLPSWQQWLLPVALVSAFMLVSRLSMEMLSL